MKPYWIVLAALPLSGCPAYGVYDRTAEQPVLTSTCYAVKLPSFLFEARCADLKAGGLGGREFCPGIQAFNPPPRIYSSGFIAPFAFPKSWADYVSDREKWDQRLLEKPLFEKQRTLIAPIDPGTQMKISGLYDYPKGETGHVSIVRALITSGPHAGTSVELTSPGDFKSLGPAWTTVPDIGKSNVEVVNTYLEPCETRP
ncbi:hypothetical protein LJR232_000863 [Aquipseudomonas alcaligenes]